MYSLVVAANILRAELAEAENKTRNSSLNKAECIADVISDSLEPAE